MSAPWTGQTGIDALANADLFLVVDITAGPANRTVSSTQVLTYIADTSANFTNKIFTGTTNSFENNSLRIAGDAGSSSNFVTIKPAVLSVDGLFLSMPNLDEDDTFALIGHDQLFSGNNSFSQDVDFIGSDLLDVNAISSNDATPEPILRFVDVPNAVNEFTIENAATGNAPILQLTGGDDDIDMVFRSKSTGDFIFEGQGSQIFAKIQGAITNPDSFIEIMAGDDSTPPRIALSGAGAPRDLHIRAESTGGVQIAGASQGLGFFNTAPVTQRGGTGETSGFIMVAGNDVTDSSTFTGAIGTKAYTISDLVKHLKQYGLLAES